MSGGYFYDLNVFNGDIGVITAIDNCGLTRAKKYAFVLSAPERPLPWQSKIRIPAVGRRRWKNC